MNCVQLERWLDEGDVAHLPAAVAEHVATCARCARSLAAARSLETALIAHFPAEPAALPERFTARVLERVDALEARRAPFTWVSETLPWWVRAMAEPTVAGAAGIVAVLLWQGDALVGFTRAALTHMATPAALPAAAPQWSGGLAALNAAFKPVPGADWAVAIGLAVGLAPLVVLAAWALWRAGERLAGGAHTAV